MSTLTKYLDLLALIDNAGMNGMSREMLTLHFEGDLRKTLRTLLTQGLVYAIEREAGTYARLQANLRQHRAYNVIPVHGEAPQCLAALPDPDGLFIGGSGGHLWGPRRAERGCAARRSEPRSRIGSFADFRPWILPRKDE